VAIAIAAKAFCTLCVPGRFNTDVQRICVFTQRREMHLAVTRFHVHCAHLRFGAQARIE